MSGKPWIEQPTKLAFAQNLARALEGAFEQGLPLRESIGCEPGNFASLHWGAGFASGPVATGPDYFESGAEFDSSFVIRDRDPMPGFDQDGNLPTHYYADDKQYDSPYRIDMEEFVSMFGFNEYRMDMISGFRDFIDYLHERGFSGIIWVGGSFVSQKELPSDIDITFFFRSKIGPVPMRTNKISHDPIVLNRPERLEKFKCDCFFVDMSWSAERLIYASALWFGHFSGFTNGISRGFVQLSI